MGYLEDGRGSGRKVEIDEEYKIRAAAITEPEFDHAAEYGDSYAVASDIVSLTNQNETAVLYLRNNRERSLYIKSFNLTWDKDAGATKGVLVKLYKGIEAGTIIDNKLPAKVNNYDLGSPKQFSVAYRGVQGDTITSATFMLSFFFDVAISAGTQTIQANGLRLLQGQTLGITITPPSGITSVDVGISFNCFYKLEGTS